MKILLYIITAFCAMCLFLCNGFAQSGWVLQNSGTTSDLFGVWFINAETGIAVGGFPENCILSTSNAGASWNVQLLEDNINYSTTVRFSDTKYGWISGGNGVILRSEDFGATWIHQASGTSSNLETIWSIGADSAWAGGAFGTLIHTTDGGDNWDNLNSGISSHIFELYFHDQLNGYAVAGSCLGCYPVDTAGGYILRTSNGGTDWSVVKKDTTTIGFYGISFSDSNTGTVVGAGGMLFQTTDGGDTWIDHSNKAWPELWDVFYVNEDTGFIAGGNWNVNSEGIILRTTDGGTTWTEQEIPTDKALNRIFFTDAHTGTVVGNDGIVLHTTNGGEIIPDKIDEINTSIYSIFPNPVAENLTIKSAKKISLITTVELLDISGNLVYMAKISPGGTNHHINLTSFEKGLYLIRISNTDYTVTKKVIKVE